MRERGRDRETERDRERCLQIKHIIVVNYILGEIQGYLKGTMLKL